MYKPEVEIVESFLQKKRCEVDVPLTTDGNKLMVYGVMVAQWDGEKLKVMSDRVERVVVKGMNYARAIRRICSKLI